MMTTKEESDSYVMDDDDHLCVVCKETKGLGIQYGGKGGFVANGDRFIHATCLSNNIRLLICEGKLYENISFDPLSNGWYFYNWNDEYGSYDHVDPRLTYCPLCSKLLSTHETILEIEKPVEKEEDNKREYEHQQLMSYDKWLENNNNNRSGVFHN